VNIKTDRIVHEERREQPAGGDHERKQPALTAGALEDPKLQNFKEPRDL
jgi:hypothetical protein